MSKLIRQHQDYNKLEIRNVSIEKLASDPTGAGLYEGRIWLNTTSFALKQYKNGAVVFYGHIDDALVSTLNTYSASKIEALLAALAGGTPWRPNVIAVQNDATLDPTASPTLGDRYALNDVGNLNANFGTIVGVGNGDIVEYDGVAFIISYDASVQNPDGGSFCYVDSIGSLYVLTGSLQWSSFIVAASTTVAGIVELATQVEAEATADLVRAVTPVSLVRFAQRRKVSNLVFVAGVSQNVTHTLGATAVIQKATAFDAGTNNNPSDLGFTNNGDGTVAIVLDVSETVDIEFVGTIS